MECYICLELIHKSAILSCCHHFCYECIKKSYIKGNNTCPICKNIINEIKFDIEFDKINNPNQILKLNENKKKNIIIINFKNNDKAGLTLVNNTKNNIRYPGVKIKKIDHNKIIFKSGLKENDIILFLNNIPCLDHRQSIDIIDYCCTNGKELRCEILI